MQSVQTILSPGSLGAIPTRPRVRGSVHRVYKEGSTTGLVHGDSNMDTQCTYVHVYILYIHKYVHGEATYTHSIHTYNYTIHMYIYTQYTIHIYHTYIRTYTQYIRTMER